jgi:EAL domain-containing protein (putative c-di-GMP-specific phosphodiesterase class I)
VLTWDEEKMMAYDVSCLVVDDDPMFNLVAEAVLKSLTHGRVITTSNAKDGLQVLNGSAPIDFVFLDLNMPDLDGLAFLRAASEAGFKGQVVISSGEDRAILQSAQTMGRMLGVSIAGALRKPLQLSEVKAMLELGRHLPLRVPSQASEIILQDDQYDLTPYYQAQFDLSTGEIKGVEALIRLCTTDGQIHGPSKLFDSLRDGDHLTEVSLRISARVLQDAKTWRAQGITHTVSINFDASVLEQPESVAEIVQSVRQAGIDPKSICLEVTEKSLPKNTSRLIEALARLRMTGFNLALDDYGTGASNFELLRQCPFSELKFDRSIVAGAVRDPITRRFVNSSAELARDLELLTVAEGVENHAELGVVLEAEIDRVQGFLFARPKPEAAVRRLLCDYRSVDFQRRIAG